MSNRRVEAFLVRIVIEEDQPTAPSQWCGRIQHVATGDTRSFQHVDELIAFIQDQFSAEQDALKPALVIASDSARDQVW